MAKSQCGTIVLGSSIFSTHGSPAVSTSLKAPSLSRGDGSPPSSALNDGDGGQASKNIASPSAPSGDNRLAVAARLVLPLPKSASIAALPCDKSPRQKNTLPAV